MKPINVKSSMYIDFDFENNGKDPKFRVGDHVRISKYKIVVAKGYTLYWFEEVSVVKRSKKNCALSICY